MKAMRWLFILSLIACGKTTIAPLHLPASQPISAEETCSTPPCPVVMVDGQQSAYALAVDADNIYWTTLVGGTVMQAPINSEIGGSATSGSTSGSGGTPITLASGQVSPFAIAVNFQAVYWACSAPAGQTTPIGSGQGTVTGVIIGNTIATVLDIKQSFPVFSIAAGVSSVFWPALSGSVVAVAGEGGAPTTIVSSLKNPTGIALDAKFVYVSVGGTGASDGLVEKIPYGYSSGKLTPGKPPVPLATGLIKPSAIAVDFTHVYWIGPGVIMSAPLDGSAAATPTTLASGGSPFALAIDASNVYWTDTSAGTVASVPLAGGTATILATGQDTPVGIAVDAANVYWTTSSAVVRQALAK
jgi:hypothetical protein